MTPLSTTAAARENLGWARQEVVDLLADLALGRLPRDGADDDAALRVADRLEGMWRSSGASDRRLALLFQLGAAVAGALDVIGELEPEVHPVEVTAELARRMQFGQGELTGPRRIVR